VLLVIIETKDIVINHIHNSKVIVISLIRCIPSHVFKAHMLCNSPTLIVIIYSLNHDYRIFQAFMN